MTPFSAWRLPLRLARRDALRHRARSLLVLVMIALPVLAVTAADVLIQTQDVSGRESLDRRIGTAQALVIVTDGVTSVEQPPDPNDCCVLADGDGTTPAPTADQVSSLLDGARLLEQRRGDVEFRTDNGVGLADATEVDLRNGLTRGLFDLTSGRWPKAVGEVVVNQALLGKGYRLGDRLGLARNGAPAAPRIVGVAESTTARTFPVAAGPIGSLGVDPAGSTQWLVDGGPLSWATVRQLNGIGANVTSRAVVQNPPPVSDWPPEIRPTSDNTNLAVLGLIAVMALIEVVLLAGPALAVTARRQQRGLALMAATGGTPRQSRRVIVAGAFVLGSVAAAAGVVLGIGAARVLEPVLQARSDTWFGPFEVPWLHVVGIAGFGMLSALLAAVVPAYLASRQDVVAVLAGRRGDKAPSLRSPMLGLVLLGVGIAGSVAGARGVSVMNTGEFLIALSAIPAVLGMILLVPVVLAGAARTSRRLPLVLRYAVRDANRHRTRTVPAIAAVAATVAGVVALGIGLSSDEAEHRATYTPSVADGVGIVHAYNPDPAWPALRAVVDRQLPGATVTDQLGLSDLNSVTEVRGVPIGLSSSSPSVGSTVMVSDDGLPLGLIGLSATEAVRAEQMLRRGGVVVFTSSGAPEGATDVKVVHHTYDPSNGENTGGTRTTAPAVFLHVPATWMGPQLVLASAVAQQLGATPQTVALAVTGVAVSEQQENDIDEALTAVDGDVGLYVERGYQPPDATVIAEIVLIVLGAVLMLGGTLTATFLALSDARPDLATLSAVGASPRTRRGVAAAYALVVGMVGAALGAAVGFIPGIAVTYPLTSGVYGSGPVLDVPWLIVIALVVALPVVTALIVGLFARSRLPMVARLD